MNDVYEIAILKRHTIGNGLREILKYRLKGPPSQSVQGHIRHWGLSALDKLGTSAAKFVSPCRSSRSIKPRQPRTRKLTIGEVGAAVIWAVGIFPKCGRKKFRHPGYEASRHLAICFLLQLKARSESDRFKSRLRSAQFNKVTITMPSLKPQLCAHAQIFAPPCSTVHQRLFYTSTPARLQIPPESPRFIDIPQSVQAEAPYRPWVKGILPVPRKIFTHKPQHQRKVTPEYLAALTSTPALDPTKQKLLETNEVVRYKTRQAAHRKRNLLEGLVELHYRHEKKTSAQSARSARRRQENIALRDMPEDESERLMRPSVLQSNTPNYRRVTADPHRASRLEQKQRNVAMTVEAGKEERQTMLHNLYVNAREFATTDTQVEDALSKAFDTNEHFSTDISTGMNIWNLGVPKNTKQIRTGVDKGVAKAVSTGTRNETLTMERLRKITEELTGGKVGR